MRHSNIRKSRTDHTHKKALVATKAWISLYPIRGVLSIQER